MLEKIDVQNVWNILKNDNKPVVLYGMGLGAEKIMDTLIEYGVEIADIFASDEFVRGHFFRGYKVLKYSDVCEKYDSFNVVLCFASHLDSVISKIVEINNQHTVFAPDVPVAGGGLFSREFVEEHEEDFDFVYNRLADEESKRVYLDILKFKISGKIEYLLNSFADKNHIYKDILNLSSQENIIDLGAYDGDTIEEFLNYTNGCYKSITALEPDEKNYKKLCKNTAHLSNIEALNMGAWHEKDVLIFSKKAGRNSKLSAQGVPVKVTDIDSLNLQPTFIKMDIEGAEEHAIDGAKNTISTFKPKLYICAYHRNSDLFLLPKKILTIYDRYKVYFRHSKYIPAWESNFYFVNEQND